MPFIIPGSGIATPTLLSYITDAQRLLHDSSYRFYSEAELIDYANKGRRKVAAETGCTRQLIEQYELETGTKSIPFSSLQNGVIGILDIYLFYSATTRYPLGYFPYSEFSRKGSVVYQYNGVPAIWSQLPGGGGEAYISSIPAQNYYIDIDVALAPSDLAANDDGSLTVNDDDIFYPFSECVGFYMAYLAKLKDQRREEANAFLGDYFMHRNSFAASTTIRRLTGR